MTHTIVNSLHKHIWRVSLVSGTGPGVGDRAAGLPYPCLHEAWVLVYCLLWLKLAYTQHKDKIKMALDGNSEMERNTVGKEKRERARRRQNLRPR
jgi:hypothetical protein